VSRSAFTFYEFFAGGGMARLGLGAGWRCLFANDCDAVKAATYRANFGGEDLCKGDVFDLSADDLPGLADLAWASSPCQDLSLAGGRAGLAGGRSSALLGFWRLIEALNARGRAPRMVVIENVGGLLTSHGGRDFEAVCRALRQEGYRFGALEIDAARFVPQSRRRVFIVGAREAVEGFEGEGFETPAVRQARERLPAELRRSWVHWPAPAPDGRNIDLAALLEADDAVPWRSDAQTLHLISLMDARNRSKLEAARQAGERRVGAVFRRVRSGKQRAEVRFDGVAGCLRTPRGGSSRQALMVVEGEMVRSRLITPREAARLMGLPDSYVLPATTTAALQVAGDGVAVPVVRWLAATVVEPLLSGAHKPVLKKTLAA
jgi:DNA (cytosine-5)-methyltransferase 1